MNFSYWFSKRISLRKGTTASTTTGAIIAVAGVALALMVMELTLAVVAGFKHEIERKVMGFDATITVLPPYNYYTGVSEGEMTVNDTLRTIITDALPGAVPVETFRRHAIMKTDSDFVAVECFAYGDAHDRSFEAGNLVRGGFTESDDSIVISETIARQLGIDTASRAYLYFFIDGKPKARRAYVSGIYESNFGEYDKSVIYTSLPFLQTLGADSARVTGIAIEGLEYGDIDLIADDAADLQRALIDHYRLGDVANVYPVTSILERGAVFFSWLDLLDTNVVVIFILMVCVAVFTLISSLFIIILDRVSTIGILRALGASRSVVSRAFVFVALKIVGIGMLIGNALALGIIWLQHATHFLSLNPEMYYLDSVPFDLSWRAALLLNVGVIVGAWLILILPAKVAARINPASTMRYE